jgi:hypothetical protein
MPEDEIIRKIFVEGDLSNFEDFFDPDWVKNINGLIENTTIEKIVGNFAANWWGNARAFVLPWLLVPGVSDVINEFFPISLDVSPQRTWNEYLKHPEFNIALWKLSENVYCSIYFAYENLIVNVLKEILVKIKPLPYYIQDDDVIISANLFGSSVAGASPCPG